MRLNDWQVQPGVPLKDSVKYSLRIMGCIRRLDCSDSRRHSVGAARSYSVSMSGSCRYCGARSGICCPRAGRKRARLWWLASCRCCSWVAKRRQMSPMKKCWTCGRHGSSGMSSWSWFLAFHPQTRHRNSSFDCWARFRHRLLTSILNLNSYMRLETFVDFNTRSTRKKNLLKLPNNIISTPTAKKIFFRYWKF